MKCGSSEFKKGEKRLMALFNKIELVCKRCDVIFKLDEFEEKEHVE